MFEPDPVLLTLIFVKRFVYVEGLALLALLRTITASGPSRAVAALTLVAACCAILAIFAPVLDIATGDGYGFAARALTWGDGYAIPLILSTILALSAILPGVRWRWIDIAHAMLAALLFGLWTASVVA